MRIFPRNADNIHGTWISPWNVDDIHGTGIFSWNADISIIISTTRRKERNLTHNLTPHLYLFHITQHHITLTPRPRLVISPTRCWRPLPRFTARAFDVLHITVWVLRVCIVFIWWPAFKNGDTILGCKPLKIHFRHQHRHHSMQSPLLWRTECFNHNHGRQ